MAAGDPRADDEPAGKETLARLESLAYHKWSVLRAEAERAHAEYVRVADRVNALKLAEAGRGEEP